MKQKFKCEGYKHCLEGSRLKNKVNQPEQNTADVDFLGESHEEFIKNKKLILKSQQILKIEKHNVFTDEVNKIVWSAKDDKRKQSIDSIEICAFKTSNYIVCKKEETKCNTIIKQYKND